jgi:hypothetical protein
MGDIERLLRRRGQGYGERRRDLRPGSCANLSSLELPAWRGPPIRRAARYNRRSMSSADDLRALRLPLLALHKTVLGTERRALERVHGDLGGAQFLQIVSDPLRYGWLQPFSALILALDDTLDVRDEDDEIVTPEEIFARARELLLPPKADTAFGRRYLSLMQKEPELVLGHAEVAKLLR